MKRNFLTFIFIIVILLPGNLKAQQYELKWEALNIGTNAKIYDITSIGEDTIIACGSLGTIIKSIDAGKTWQKKESDSTGPYQYFSEIQFADANVGYVIDYKSYYCRLLKTTDAGETWNTISKFDNIIDNLFIVDKDTLYINVIQNINDSIDKLYKSTDGGKTWNLKFAYDGKLEFNGHYGYWINSIFFKENVGYVLGSQIIDEMNGIYKYNLYKSYDYGNTWDQIAEFENIWQMATGLMIGYEKRPAKLYFDNINSGKLYMEGQTISTEDGFNTYLTKVYYMHEIKDFKIHFQSNRKYSMIYNEIYIMNSYKSYMKYSNDNGKTWIFGKKDEKPYNSNGITYNSIYQTKNSVFYLAHNKGIFRSPELPSTIKIIDSNNINLYPNPVITDLTIETDNLNISKIAVFDLMGKPILSIDIAHTESFKLDCSNFSTGIYLLKITTNQGIISKKISKL